MAVQRITLKEFPPIVRRINKDLMANWINTDLVNRSNYDVKKSWVLYDHDKMFLFALHHEPSELALSMLADKVGFVSRGVV